MSQEGPPQPGFRRRSFPLSTDSSDPPLRGADNVSPANELAALLECLIGVSDRHIIPAPAAAPDPCSLTDTFGAMLRAAQDFEVVRDIALADHLWTHAAPLQSGEVASVLIRRGRAGRPIPGLVLLYAADVRSPLLYLPQRQPLRIRDGIALAQRAIGGPFLALALCEVTPDGQVQSTKACAMPVYHAGRFVPVTSDLDRDVLRALEHLQIALDAHGVECAIRRELPFFDTTSTRLTLSLAWPDQAMHEIHLGVSDEESDWRLPVGLLPVDFLVTTANWKDGSFIQWLGKTLT